MLKFTLVVSSIRSDLMAETIWVRFSAGGAAVADAAPVVVWVLEPDLVSWALSFDMPPLSLDMPSLDWALSFDMPFLSLDMPSLDCALSFDILSLVCAFLLPSLLLSRPSAFWSLPPLVRSVSVAVFCCDFWPLVASSDCLAPPFWSDCPDFMPDEPSSLCCVAEEPPPRSDDGALCCVVAPPAPPPFSIPPPAPCAFAKPVPAIRAAAATEIKKRLVIEVLLTCLHCPRRQRKRMSDVPGGP